MAAVVRGAVRGAARGAVRGVVRAAEAREAARLVGGEGVARVLLARVVAARVVTHLALASEDPQLGRGGGGADERRRVALATERLLARHHRPAPRARVLLQKVNVVEGACLGRG
jgi:hypothetical protein